ncbi:MAG: NAD(P)/FAD-dependent oxidoreductase [Bacteroidales bacterium]|nr:NAD(P)/FAD-dependent oxidoreductase [Bacteroidales bacterium]
MNFDFIIIGSGIGGLVSGIILAKEGYSVCILEKNHQAGGNLQTFKRDGYKFSTGLHYIGSMDEGQTLHRFFKYLGIIRDLKLKKLDIEGYDRIVFGDEETYYNLAQGWDHFKDSLTGQFPEEKAAIDGYVATVQESIRSIPLYDLENADSFNLELSRLNRCTMSYLKSITQNHRLQHVLAGANSVYHGAARRTPLYMHSCIRNSFVSSAWKVSGGSDHLTDVLLQAFSAAGGTIVTDAPVTGFSMDNNHIDSVILKDGRIYYGRQFISNMHPAATLQLTGLEKIRTGYRKRIESLENTAGFFTLYLVFKEDFFPYLNYNLFQYYHDDYFNDELPEERWPHSYVIYIPFYDEDQKFTRTASIISFMKNDECRKWDGLAPDQRGQDYYDFRERKAEKLLDAVEKRYPGIRSGIEKYYVSTPLTFKDFTGTPEGSGYGILKDCENPARSIVLPQTKIPNLYFTGQNLNIHGILGTITSAFITCSEFIGFKNLVRKIIHA